MKQLTAAFTMSKPSRTKLDCPHCKKVVPCLRIEKPGKGQRGRVFSNGLEDIIWFKRWRKCTNCGYEFVTAELEARHLDELRRLRRAAFQNHSSLEKEMSALKAEADRLRARMAELRKNWLLASKALNGMGLVFFPPKSKAPGTPANDEQN